MEAAPVLRTLLSASICFTADIMQPCRIERRPWPAAAGATSAPTSSRRTEAPQPLTSLASGTAAGFCWKAAYASGPHRASSPSCCASALSTVRLSTSPLSWGPGCGRPRQDLAAGGEHSAGRRAGERRCRGAGSGAEHARHAPRSVPTSCTRAAPRPPPPPAAGTASRAAAPAAGRAAGLPGGRRGSGRRCRPSTSAQEGRSNRRAQGSLGNSASGLCHDARGRLRKMYQ